MISSKTIAILCLTILCVFSIECKRRVRRDFNSHLVMKQLAPIEIVENIPIGQTIIDLKKRLEDTDDHGPPPKSTDPTKAAPLSYADFQFIDKLNGEYSSDVTNILRKYFLLDPLTGKIQTSKLIDLENFCELNICHSWSSEGHKKVCSIPFKIKASKQDSSYHVQFELVIKDDNEFAPKFDQDLLRLNVTEEFAPIRLPIGKVAYDSDCTDRNSLSYSIEIQKVNGLDLKEFLRLSKINVEQSRAKGSNIFDLKVITDPANMLLFLYTYKPFDRELIQHLVLHVIATDRIDKDDAKRGVLTVEINIADINDNAPIFRQKIYNLEFDEGLLPNTKLIRLEADDSDEGLNGQVRYELSEMAGREIHENFELVPETGDLILKNKLAYNARQNNNLWQISVRATDQSLSLVSRKSGMALVNIRVNDVNDHRPEMSMNFFHMPSLIEPRMLVRRHLNNDVPDSSEQIVYLARNFPKNSVIGILSINDEDTELNGELNDCQIAMITGKSHTREIHMPIKLESFDQTSFKSESFEFSSDSFLNNEMKFLFSYGIPNSFARRNERRYFLRTAVNFNSTENYELKLKVSDKGSKIQQSSEKSFKLFVLSTDNNLISQTSYDYEDYNSEVQSPIDVRLQEHIEHNGNDYHSAQHYFSKSIYKIYVTEHNPTPMKIAVFNEGDFMLNTRVKYELLMPHEISPSQRLNLTEASKALQQCSISLKRYLEMDPISGVLMLNKTLDQNECSDYSYFIKATDLFQERISSMLSFKIHVTSSKARFKHRHNTINVTENSEMSINLLQAVKIYNYKSDIQLRLDENSKAANRDFFTIDTDENTLVFKKRPDFEERNYFRFELVMSQLGRDLDTTQVEINVLDQNEYSPVVEAVTVGAELENTRALGIYKISDDYTYLVTANLSTLLGLNHSFYFELFHIRASDMDNSDSGGGGSHVDGFKLAQVVYYDLVSEEINSERYNKLKEFNASQFKNLFLVEEAGVVKINLKHLSPQVYPTVVFLQVRVSDKGVPDPLETTVNIKLVLNKNLPDEKYQKLQMLLVQRFSSAAEKYLHVVFPTKLTAAGSNNVTTLNTLFKETRMPVVIITILIVVLVISLGSLFVISLAYSMSICKICPCVEDLSGKSKKKRKQQNQLQTYTIAPGIDGLHEGLNPMKEFDDEETEETEDNISDSNHGMDGEDLLNERSPMNEKCVVGSLQRGSKSPVVCSSGECEHEFCLLERKRQKVVQQVVQQQQKMTMMGSSSFRKESNMSDKSGSVFIDGPIALTKPSTSTVSSELNTYPNKQYNLEYQFEHNDEYLLRRNNTNNSYSVNNNNNNATQPNSTYQPHTNTIIYNENRTLNRILKVPSDSYRSDSIHESDFSTPARNQHFNNNKQSTLKATSNMLSIPRKKLSFKEPEIHHRNSITSENNTNTSSELDDDFILPGHRDFHSQLKNTLKFLEPKDYNYSREENILNRQDSMLTQHEYLSYKKAQVQPEDNVWVKKSTIMANGAHQHHHQQQHQHQNGMPYSTSNLKHSSSSFKNHIEVSI